MNSSDHLRGSNADGGDSALMETCWLLVLLLLCFCSGPLSGHSAGFQ